MPNAKPSVFISHSWSDQDWAKAFARSLKNSGQDVWLDWDMPKSVEFIEQWLDKGLRESSLLVFLVDGTDANRPNLFFELGAALAMRKPMVFVRPAEVNLKDLPAPLRKYKFLLKGTPEATAQELLHEVAA